VLAVVALVAAAWPVVTSTAFWLLHAGRPFTPFMGHKLLMGSLGLTCNRLTLGILFIVATAVNAIVLWFALDLGVHTDLVTLAEPWVTLIYMLIGLVTLRMLEQRKLASVQLLRAEVEASAMERRALMLLAVGDRLNSPLQTLLLAASSAIAQLPAACAARIQGAIDRLVALSRELADLEIMLEQRPPSSGSLDAHGELRRRV
jgi:hypothetical protein